jgi:FlaA1/EpsC-like NDP-sugar epimerase
MTLMTKFRTRIIIPYQSKYKYIEIPAILLRSSFIDSLPFLKPHITKTMYNLMNRKVLVTGASRGLGAAIAKAFAQEGCDLAITYLASEVKAEAVASEIRSSTGRKVVVLQAVSSKMKSEPVSADIKSPRNYPLSRNAKELLKRQSKPLGDLTLLFTTL